MKTAEEFFKDSGYKPDESVFTSGHYDLPYYSDWMIIEMIEAYGDYVKNHIEEDNFQEGYNGGFEDGRVYTQQLFNIYESNNTHSRNS